MTNVIQAKWKVWWIAIFFLYKKHSLNSDLKKTHTHTSQTWWFQKLVVFSCATSIFLALKYINVRLTNTEKRNFWKWFLTKCLHYMCSKNSPQSLKKKNICIITLFFFLWKGTEIQTNMEVYNFFIIVYKIVEIFEISTCLAGK